MMDPSNTLSDPHLEASTTLSLKREPACFAFLCSRAVSAPLPIDAINLDLASVDYFRGRASLWATLEVRSGFIKEQPTAVLGFDESFLQPFTRALIQAATSRERFRMTILHEADGTLRQRVVEYVTGTRHHATRYRPRCRRPRWCRQRRRDPLSAATERCLPARLRRDGLQGRPGAARHAARK
jgi:hypothetical protein